MKTVKITSGEYKGRSIVTPGGKTHPMGERERLALFNMISGDLPEAMVLDAFAGSGALGIEALSRGAREVVFVEKNPGACRIINSNLVSLGASGQVVRSDVVNFTTSEKFDVVLADPPYDDFDIKAVKSLIELIKDGGTLVLSHPEGIIKLPGLELLKSRQYAAAHISVYAKR